MVINNHTRQFSKIIYRLKRSHGCPILLTNQINRTRDILTGQVTSENEEHRIRRAIVLEGKEAQETFLTGRQFRSSNTIFIEEQIVIIDERDIRSFNLTTDTTLKFADEDFNIAEITKLKDNKARLLVIRRAE